MKKNSFVLILATALFASCDKNDDYHTPEQPQIEVNFLKSAGDSAAIIGTVNQFRTLLGDSLNTAPGKTTGRREVNWDGVPANLTNNDNFPLDFFNNTDPAGPNGRKRGLVYLPVGPIRIDSSSFAEIDASYETQFSAFSRKRAVISANSNITEIVFKVPGSATDASVRGFGIIFSDVDSDKSTFVEYYDGAKLLGKFYAPARNDKGGFSFLGVKFPNEKVTMARITAGSGALAAGYKDISDGGDRDLVVYDDFFYDEPQPLN
jgi:hypothetical protein